MDERSLWCGVTAPENSAFYELKERLKAGLTQDGSRPFPHSTACQADKAAGNACPTRTCFKPTMHEVFADSMLSGKRLSRYRSGRSMRLGESLLNSQKFLQD